MRYEIRWSNGYWKVFDTRFYCSVEAFGLRTHAEDALLEWMANE